MNVYSYQPAVNILVLKSICHSAWLGNKNEDKVKSLQIPIQIIQINFLLWSDLLKFKIKNSYLEFLSMTASLLATF